MSRWARVELEREILFRAWYSREPVSLSVIARRAMATGVVRLGKNGNGGWRWYDVRADGGRLGIRVSQAMRGELGKLVVRGLPLGEVARAALEVGLAAAKEAREKELAWLSERLEAAIPQSIRELLELAVGPDGRDEGRSSL